MLPCVFILMNRHRAIDYQTVLSALKEEASENGLTLAPEFVMTDFELSAINAFKSTFPSVENKGYLFHFCQSLFKYLVKIGLKSEVPNLLKLE